MIATKLGGRAYRPLHLRPSADTTPLGLATEAITMNEPAFPASLLTEEQIQAYVRRCPIENRWAFEGWLRGERYLDGDLIQAEPSASASWKEIPCDNDVCTPLGSTSSD